MACSTRGTCEPVGGTRRQISAICTTLAPGWILLVLQQLFCLLAYRPAIESPPGSESRLPGKLLLPAACRLSLFLCLPSVPSQPLPQDVLIVQQMWPMPRFLSG